MEKAQELLRKLEECFGTWDTEKKNFGQHDYQSICKILFWSNSYFSRLLAPLKKDSENRNYEAYKRLGYDNAIGQLQQLIDFKKLATEKTTLENQLAQQAQEKQTPSNKFNSRRNVLGLLTLGVIGGVTAPSILSNFTKKIVKLEHYYPEEHPILFQELEKWRREINDNFDSIFIAPPTQSAAPLQDAYGRFRASDIDLFHTVTYYTNQTPDPLYFFGAIPFGMDRDTFDLWFYEDPKETKFEKFIKGRNHLLFPLGNTGTQAGGWFLKEIQSVADLKNLKMRIFGMGGAVLKKLSSEVSLIPKFLDLPQLIQEFKKIPTAQRKNFAFEYVNAYTDQALKYPEFYETMKSLNHELDLYFYEKGWHEPGTIWSLLAKKETLKHLEANKELEKFKWITTKYHHRITNQYIAKGQQQLLLWKKEGVPFKILPSFPMEVKQILKQKTIEVLKEFANNSEFDAIYKDYAAFHLTMNQVDLT